MSFQKSVRELLPFAKGYWGERILAQLSYADELSKSLNGKYKKILLDSAKVLLNKAQDNGVINREDVVSCENSLASLKTDAKSLTVHAIGHAHIDMNWMWRYDETVNITLETFRTVLKLMEDFPEFTFSQSQSSCYRIVEKYDKALLGKIKEKIKSGHWETTASTWVETDKNLPSGESLARHILYTKQYMKKLLNLEYDDLKLDFEPDTFGHNANVPEILSQGGIEYYYHCRGYDKNEIYNWKSPSGESILVYREPTWYLGGITSGIFSYVPSFCVRNDVKDVMEVYGVGDHGGGPTRKDLEFLSDMKTWPIFPTIIFSSFLRYFETIKPLKNQFPIVDHELNFVFTGCYTTQTRIKAANRLGEAALFEAEAFTALSPVSNTADTSLFEDAWRKVLFNQFHDIIPGSGVIDTREHALGLFQEVLANANSQKGIVCYALANQIDTSAAMCNRPKLNTTSEGAGVGYAVEEKYNLSHVERGLGLRRGYLLFNSAGARYDVSEFSIWDWPGDIDALTVTDHNGNELPYQILNQSKQFWAHECIEIAVYCSVPAMGWQLIIIDEDSDKEISITKPSWWDMRVHHPYEFILENNLLRVVIDPSSGFIAEILDKRTGEIAAQNCGFFGLTESSLDWGTSWIVSRYKNDETPCVIDNIEWLHTGDVRKSVKIDGRYNNSRVSYTISLDRDSEYISITANVDWLEVGSREAGIPQLHYVADYVSPSNEYLYDIPFGTIKRPAMDMDVPGQSYVCSLPEEKPALAIFSTDKYAYRCVGDKMSLTLIRSSFDPDPFPELCRHKFTFRLAVPAKTTAAYLKALSERLCHPPFVQSVPAHDGKLPPTLSLLHTDVAISGIKPAEDGSGDIIVRIYDNNDKSENVSVSFATNVKAAWLCSLMEVKYESLKVNENSISVPLRANGMATIRVRVK